LNVSVDATGSTPGSAPIGEYRIDLGDGDAVNSATVIHRYQRAGSFTVRVTVTDRAGRSDSQTATVRVGAVQMYRLGVTLNGSADAGTVTGPGGIQCPTACAATFPSGQSVTLTARPDAAATFDGWSGGCAGTATRCTVTMNQVRTVTATFTLGTPGISLRDLGCPSAHCKQYRISSTGTAPLVISDITAVGQQVSVTKDCVRTIAVGGSCDLTITYTPPPPNTGQSVKIYHNAAGGVTTIVVWSASTPSSSPTATPTLSGPSASPTR
jgi:hypothetical protein